MGNLVAENAGLEIIRGSIKALLPSIESKSNEELLAEIENDTIFTLLFNAPCISKKNDLLEKTEPVTKILPQQSAIRGVVCKPENKDLIKDALNLATETADVTAVVSLLASFLGIPIAAVGTVPSVLVKVAVLLTRFGIDKFCTGYQELV